MCRSNRSGCRLLPGRRCLQGHSSSAVKKGCITRPHFVPIRMRRWPTRWAFARRRSTRVQDRQGQTIGQNTEEAVCVVADSAEAAPPRLRISTEAGCAMKAPRGGLVLGFSGRKIDVPERSSQRWRRFGPRDMAAGLVSQLHARVDAEFGIDVSEV